MKKKNDSAEMARKGLRALRRAARNAHRIAAAYGTPIWIEKNGKDHRAEAKDSLALVSDS